MGATRLSDGLVTPTALAALEAAGYDRPFAELVPAVAGQAHAPLIPADWRQLQLDPTARTVALPAGIRLDLGGTAKGWAAAQAVRRLSSAGPALVDAGGDIVVSGPMVDGGPWPIAIAARSTRGKSRWAFSSSPRPPLPPRGATTAAGARVGRSATT